MVYFKSMPNLFEPNGVMRNQLGLDYSDCFFLLSLFVYSFCKLMNPISFKGLVIWLTK